MEIDRQAIKLKEDKIARLRKMKNVKQLVAAANILKRLVKEKQAVDERQNKRAEEATAAMLERFQARVEAVFKKLDSDQSGELSMAEMERTFGEETHDFWENMDGEAGARLSVKHAIVWSRLTIDTCCTVHDAPFTLVMHAPHQVMRQRAIMTAWCV